VPDGDGGGADWLSPALLLVDPQAFLGSIPNLALIIAFWFCVHVEIQVVLASVLSGLFLFFPPTYLQASMWKQWNIRTSVSQSGMWEARTRLGLCGGTTSRTLR
jgi:hypothetical protein